MQEAWLFEPELGPVAEVALDLPVRRQFSYVIPAGMGEIEVGCRVRVTFGGRLLIGVVTGCSAGAPPGVPAHKLKDLVARLDHDPILTPALLRLARWIADTTYCSWGNALAAMLPAALRRDRVRRSVPVVEADPEALERLAPEALEELARKHPKMERALAFLRRAGGPMEIREFRNRTGLSRSPLDSLARRGLVRFARKQEVLDPFRGIEAAPEQPPRPTAEQASAIEAIHAELDARRPADFLLHGVTGSGKTEVYLRALDRCLAQGRGAIVLVPEIALTPQTVARFRARCGRVAVLHSGLTDAERHDQWLALRRGELRVVVGARSALFAPIPDLGLIVVDEEHESTFKQESTPRYNARDVARERARLENAVCVLGSATPSLESWSQARQGRIHLLTLPERVAGGRLPEVEVVDMRVQKPVVSAGRRRWAVVSEPLRRALEETLDRGQRAILFLNQRGFAPAWHCKSCGASVSCDRCDVSLTYHRWRRKALCHYCLAESPPPDQCPECASRVTMIGVGTERAEDSLAALFPQARIARMDRDTMLRRESYEEVLGRFGRGEIDVLLGTQMVAKGLDFPEVTLVGVLNADLALHQPDFRAAERCFNLVTQVSGRAGRSARGGRVVVQTWMPEHPALRAAVRHDYAGFSEWELEEREMFRYPPFTRAFRVLIEADAEPEVERRSAEIRARLDRARGGDSETCSAGGIDLLGPAPPPQARLRGRYRRQILLKADLGPDLGPIRAVLEELCQESGVSIDPL